MPSPDGFLSAATLKEPAYIAVIARVGARSQSEPQHRRDELWSKLGPRFRRIARNFIADNLHQRIFPASVLASDSAAAQRFNLMAGGSYFALGAGGPITGRGADLR